MECPGRDVLLAHIEKAQQCRPGATFRNDQFLAHHGHALTWWRDHKVCYCADKSLELSGPDTLVFHP